MTSSLTANPLALPPPAPPPPWPSSSTTPARSLPCPDGNVAGNIWDRAPERILPSPGLIPAAFTRTRTCPRPGTGRSISTTCRTSTPPYSSNLTALGMARTPLDPAAPCDAHRTPPAPHTYSPLPTRQPAAHPLLPP